MVLRDNIYLLFLILLVSPMILLTSCQQQQSKREVMLVVSNPNDYDISEAVNGIALQAVMDSLEMIGANQIEVLDQQGKVVPTQIFDNGMQKLLLFECSVIANGESTYSLHDTGLPIVHQKSDTERMPIAEKFEKMRGIRMMADSISSTLSTTYWTDVPQKQHQIDSLLELLDPILLGSFITTYPTSPLRNPWNYEKLDILAEGPLMCAYQLTYDTLFVANDTLVEHRTLVMQSGSNLTIVRGQMQNVAMHDTLIQHQQVVVKVPYQQSDSLVLNDAKQSLAIAHRDSSATGILIPMQYQAQRISEPRQFSYIIPCPADSIYTYYIASTTDSERPLTIEDATKELQRMHEAPLSVRIIIKRK